MLGSRSLGIASVEHDQYPPSAAHPRCHLETRQETHSDSMNQLGGFCTGTGRGGTALGGCRAKSCWALHGVSSSLAQNSCAACQAQRPGTQPVIFSALSKGKLV